MNLPRPLPALLHLILLAPLIPPVAARLSGTEIQLTPDPLALLALPVIPAVPLLSAPFFAGAGGFFAQDRLLPLPRALLHLLPPALLTFSLSRLTGASGDPRLLLLALSGALAQSAMVLSADLAPLSERYGRSSAALMLSLAAGGAAAATAALTAQLSPSFLPLIPALGGWMACRALAGAPARTDAPAPETDHGRAWLGGALAALGGIAALGAALYL